MNYGYNQLELIKMFLILLPKKKVTSRLEFFVAHKKVS